jgi:hypothetical protein
MKILNNKILFIFSSLIILTPNLFAQEKEEDVHESDFKRIQIGINFSPDYCYRILKSDDSENADLVTALRDKNETVKLGYTTGLNLVYNFNKRFGVEIGAQFSNKGYRTKKMNYGDPIDSRNGFNFPPPNNEPVSGKFIYNNYYIDVPLKVNFILGKKKIRFISSAGFATNIFIKETSKLILDYDDGSTEKRINSTPFDYNRINISLMISAGIDWKINSKNNLRVEPTFRYGVLKTIDAPVTAYLWSAGLNIGYYFGLN